MGFSKSCEVQDSGTKGWGSWYSCQQSLSLHKVITGYCTMKGAAPAHLETWELIMAQGFTVPFSLLAVRRGQRGNKWLLLLHHSNPSLSIWLQQRASDKMCNHSLPSSYNEGTKKRDACSTSNHDIQTILLPRLQQITQIPNYQALFQIK